MGTINTNYIAKALTCGICAIGLFMLAFTALIELTPVTSRAYASLHHNNVMRMERAQSPCIGCHRIYHRAAYIAIGEQKFLKAYPTFKPETPWYTRGAISDARGLIGMESQWRVYHERWPIPGSGGEHDDALEVYIFENGSTLVFTHYSRLREKVTQL